MAFTQDSFLVQFYVKKVREGAVARENIPKLFNLQEMVYGVLDEE